VYNTRAYIKQCISSVLAQTYTDFEYLLIDNGCTDGSSKILDEYSRRDSRIHLIRYEKNTRIYLQKLLRDEGKGKFVTILDSDDWWEPDYLKRMMELAVDTDADIITTGTLMHQMESGDFYPRRLNSRLVLDCQQFSEFFSVYHVFFRTVWAKLIRREVFLNARVMNPEELTALGIWYGTDTLTAFAWLRLAEKICIDDSVLHHYRVHRVSSSYQYDSGRFDADVYLYNDAIDFLSTYGPVSRKNRDFLQCVYANAVTDTTEVIHNSSLSPEDKLHEYSKIASHPLTQAAYRECTYDYASRSRANLLQAALRAGAELGSKDDRELKIVMQSLSPRCGPAVSRASTPLFKNPKLLQALLSDEPEPVLEALLFRMKENQGIKKFAVQEAIQALAADKPLLCQIKDTAFLRRYGDIYRMVWNENTFTALEEMTGLLLENRVDGGKETFLQLYISLAAAENQAPAFIFGKLQLAGLYLRQNRRDECRAAVDELAELGADNGELAELRRQLEAKA